ncbi:metal ABC transporter ATP-binding protein [Gordonia sihwensis]|uniref:metal ABC transporter ATP-binding protein n=1 Tax=Gordonia sihwensis TaxID=173559 RepID=UPI003D98EDDF
MTATGYTVRGLSFSYGATTVLENLTTTLQPGAVTALVGANGTGKSTLLELIAGVRTPDAGEITPRPRRPALLTQRSEHIDGLPLTVRDCVRIGTFGQVPCWRPTARRERRAAEEIIERVGMTPLRESRMRDLSGGQRQRVLIAQTLVQRADLYLLDEPSTALDAGTRELLCTLLREHADVGKTVVVASHDRDEIRFADTVIELASPSMSR